MYSRGSSGIDKTQPIIIDSDSEPEDDGRPVRPVSQAHSASGSYASAPANDPPRLSLRVSRQPVVSQGSSSSVRPKNGNEGEDASLLPATTIPLRKEREDIAQRVQRERRAGSSAKQGKSRDDWRRGSQRPSVTPNPEAEGSRPTAPKKKESTTEVIEFIDSDIDDLAPAQAGPSRPPQIALSRNHEPLSSKDMAAQMASWRKEEDEAQRSPGPSRLKRPPTSPRVDRPAKIPSGGKPVHRSDVEANPMDWDLSCYKVPRRGIDSEENRSKRAVASSESGFGPLLAKDMPGSSAAAAASRSSHTQLFPPDAVAGPSRSPRPPNALSRASTDSLGTVNGDVPMVDGSVSGTVVGTSRSRLAEAREEARRLEEYQRGLGGLNDDSDGRRRSALSATLVEEAIEDATAGVSDVDITTSGSSTPPDTGPTRTSICATALKVRAEMAAMSREDKLALIEREGRGYPANLSSTQASSVDHVESTICGHPKVKAKASDAALIPSSPELAAGTSVNIMPEHPPDRYRGIAIREFSTQMVDEWNDRRADFTHKPALHRQIFQQYMAEAYASFEPHAGEINVVNTVGTADAAPDMEYQYGNDIMYHGHVPDPDTGTGCGCVGPCKPGDRGCRCVRRQELYSYGMIPPGFAYHEDGTVQNFTIPIWECGPNCGCPPTCMNRIIQRGRSKDTELDLFKTHQKGWGVKARYDIPKGTFLGIYSGELVPDYESERRSYLYDQIGRTYLFDCDSWSIRHPPDLKELRKVDPRLGDLAEQSLRRYEAVLEGSEEVEMENYSAYSVDAFHYGFTRYFNHSCDPNLVIMQAYVNDYHPERPKLVMFTRCPIVAGEEMCISYMGLPDDDEEPSDVPATKNKSNSRKKTSEKGKGKTSAKAREAELVQAVRLGAEICRCGAHNCKGYMFTGGNYAED